VQRDKFLIIKPTRCTNFSNLFLELNSTCFRQFLCPSSGVFHCAHSNGICYTGMLTAASSCKQTCITYTTAVCAVKKSSWWTEELSETCRVSFQKWIWEISASSWFIIRNHLQIWQFFYSCLNYVIIKFNHLFPVSICLLLYHYIWTKIISHVSICVPT